ncbi:MAG: hypothetical protein NTV38_00105 [Chloroflexi bacterium]|nr:hypothetical protein [Chloroflexota bacterium]
MKIGRGVYTNGRHLTRFPSFRVVGLVLALTLAAVGAIAALSPRRPL